MTPGLRILIERMREQPDDFFLDFHSRLGAHNRWNELVSVVNSLAENGCLSDEEVAAWTEAKKRLMVDSFNAKVLEAVNYVPPEVDPYQGAVGPQYSANLARSMALTKDTVTSGLFGANMITPEIAVGGAKLSESDIKHIKKQTGLK